MAALFSSNSKKKIFILLGQEDKDTFGGHLADAYEKGAKDNVHEVRRANIGDLKFDPILHKGYKVIQELEPDLKQVQEDIKWADHIVILYPTWWSSMPAILKGFFDRTWIPGFAYHFFKNGMGWHGLLHGKSARVIITMDNWPIVSRMLFGDSTNEIGRAILKFSGFRPVRIKKIGALRHADDPAKQSWTDVVYKLGKNAR